MPREEVKPQAPDRLLQVLVGEAAGEGPQGMRFVAEVMRNRAGKTKTLEEVALAPHQFSAAARPDLQQFYLRQPPEVRSMATAILREIQSESYRPQYPGIRHYVTHDLWSRRMAPSSPSWLRKMKAVQRIGNHVALVEE